MTTRRHHLHGAFMYRWQRRIVRAVGSGRQSRPGGRLLPTIVLITLSLAGSATCAASTIVTQMTYEAGDHVATVTDPRGLVTSYTRDGLGQLWQQTSPDTGTTSFAYDSYGRRSGMTRADGTQTTYAYDSLNRIASISVSGQAQALTYDSCTHGIGRLCVDSVAARPPHLEDVTNEIVPSDSGVSRRDWPCKWPFRLWLTDVF